MNERIRELFQEAIDYADKTHTYTPEEGFNIQTWDKIRFEKFAELIVAECVEVCAGIAAVRAGYNDADGRDTAYSCGDTIKEHFGVE